MGHDIRIKLDILCRDGRYFVDVDKRSECYNADLDTAAWVVGKALEAKPADMLPFLAALQ